MSVDSSETEMLIMMFSPIQIKHECTAVEEVNASDRINSSDSSLCPFINQDVEYKHRHLSQFWEQTQLPNEMPAKNEIHQEVMFHAEEAGSLSYIKNYVQNGMFYPTDQEDSNNHMQINNQCDQNTSNIVTVQENKQSQLPQALLNAGDISQALTVQSLTTVKTNRLGGGRPSKSSMESGTGKKLNKCQCEICFKEFGHKSNLFIHMRTHNGEKPYKCSQCEKCFTHSGNLAIHMRTHSGERPYGCQICGKMFSHSGNLSTHLRTHSGVKPYKCSVCGKEFRHSGNLSIHGRIHSGIKPFQCKICGKEFYHSGNLTTHMKKHPVNTNINVTDCKNNQKHILPTDTDVNTTASSNYLNNVSLMLNDDVKLMHNTSNVVPIKNENTEDTVLNTMGRLTSS